MIDYGITGIYVLNIVYHMLRTTNPKRIIFSFHNWILKNADSSFPWQHNH